MPYSEAICKRFWANVAVCAHGVECPDCCWPWLGTTVCGYGLLTVYDKDRYAKEGRGVRNLRANRLACEIATQSLLAPGFWALHKCNTPACCHYHPQHVYIGTARDNAFDTLAAGHHVTQIRRPWRAQRLAFSYLFSRRKTKLSRQDVLQIRHLAFAGFPVGTLAEIFALSHGHVSDIVRLKKWRHL